MMYYQIKKKIKRMEEEKIKLKELELYLAKRQEILEEEIEKEQEKLDEVPYPDALQETFQNLYGE